MTRDGETPAILRWWPVVAFAAAWVASGLGAFFSVQSDVATVRGQVVTVQQTISDHEIRGQREREELLLEIRELRADVKRLLERTAAK